MAEATNCERYQRGGVKITSVYDGTGEAEMIINRIVGEIDEENCRFTSRAVAYSGDFRIDVEVTDSRILIRGAQSGSTSIYFGASFTLNQ